MEGFLTRPYLQKDRSAYKLVYYVDLDPSDAIRDWKGGTQSVDTHTGIDYRAREGTSIVAAAPGVVRSAEVDWEKDFFLFYPGNRIIIDHLNGFSTAYNHLSKLADHIKPIKFSWSRPVSQLQKVTRGELIGYVGNTGNSTGPHLHFEVNDIAYGHTESYPRWPGWAGGTAIDPYRDLFHSAHASWPFSNSVSLFTRDNEPIWAWT